MSKSQFRLRVILVILSVLAFTTETINHNLCYYNWTYQQNPISGQVVFGFENTLDCPGELSAINAAAMAWNNISSFQIPTVFPGNPQIFHGIRDDGENQIGWLQEWPFNPLEIAKVGLWYQPNTRNILGVDTVFNDNMNWSTWPTQQGQYDIQSAMTHEFGHWAGLWHSPDPDDARYQNVMKSSLGMNELRRELQQDDIDGLSAIYDYIGWEGSQLTFNPRSAIQPDIAVGGDLVDEGKGNILHAVWADKSSGYYQIHYRRHPMGGNSNFPWEADQVLSASSGNCTLPRVAARRCKIYFDPWEWEYQDQVYIVWCDDSTGSNEVYFRRSTNGGLTWESSIRLTNNAGQSVSPAIAVSPEEPWLHIVWSDSTPGLGIGNTYNYEIFYLRSENFGLTWCPERRLSYKSEYPYICAYAGNPAVATDSYNEVYVVWRDNRELALGGNIQIYYAKSPCGEMEWSPDTPVTSYQTGGGCFEPAIMISEKDMFVHLVFTREMPDTYRGDIIYLKSTDYGSAWSGERNLSNNAGYSKSADIALGLKSPADPLGGYCLYAVWQDDTVSAGEDVFYSDSVTEGDTWMSRQLTSNCQDCYGVAVAGYEFNIQVVWSQVIPGLSYKVRHLRNRARF